jgi:hypothetical protein
VIDCAPRRSGAAGTGNLEAAMPLVQGVAAARTEVFREPGPMAP